MIKLLIERIKAKTRLINSQAELNEANTEDIKRKMPITYVDISNYTDLGDTTVEILDKLSHYKKLGFMPKI